MIKKIYFLVLIMFMSSAASVSMLAQSIKRPISIEEIEEAINTPTIKDKDKKGRNDIANYQVDVARRLYNELRVDVDMRRDDEVIKVTIPADLLFGPNSTSLLDNSRYNKDLMQFSRLLDSSDLYRMVLVMHHETGSEQYCKTITDRRLQSIIDWFTLYSRGAKYISAFSMGNSNPILKNDSMQNRRHNRRLEIYLVPGTVMIENAKKGKLK